MMRAKRVGLNKTPHRRWRPDGDARCSVFKDRGTPLSMGLTEETPETAEKKASRLRGRTNPKESGNQYGSRLWDAPFKVRLKRDRAV